MGILILEEKSVAGVIKLLGLVHFIFNAENKWLN